MNTNAFYQHSGRFSLIGAIITLAIGSGVGVVLGAIYGFLVAVSPIVYVNFLATLGLGAVMAWVLSALARFGKIRNLKVLGVIAFIAAAVAYYTHWVVWTRQITEVTLYSPDELWTTLSAIAALGPWSIFGWTPSGFSLYAIWGIEALMILGMGTFAAVGYIMDIPFCEETGRWVKETKYERPFGAIVDQDKLQNDLSMSPGTILNYLVPAPTDASRYTLVTAAAAEGSTLRCVSLKSVERTEEDGKENLEESDLVTNLMVDEATFQGILAACQ